MNIKARTTRTIRRTHTAARNVGRPLAYWTLSGIIAAHIATGRLITTGTFLDRIGGHDLPDGQRSWYGRHAKKAHRTATGHDPLTVWTQHRTTGRWIHVACYGPIDVALYEALRTYKGTRHLLTGGIKEVAQTTFTASPRARFQIRQARSGWYVLDQRTGNVWTGLTRAGAQRLADHLNRSATD